MLVAYHGMFVSIRDCMKGLMACFNPEEVCVEFVRVKCHFANEMTNLDLFSLTLITNLIYRITHILLVMHIILFRNKNKNQFLRVFLVTSFLGCCTERRKTFSFFHTLAFRDLFYASIVFERGFPFIKNT